MNTRIQVEHTISEMNERYRLDSRAAARRGGRTARLRTGRDRPCAATRSRCASTPRTLRPISAPPPARFSAYREPARFRRSRRLRGVRRGSSIKGDFDSMIAKLIVAAPTRAQAFCAAAARDRRLRGSAASRQHLPFLRALIRYGRRRGRARTGQATLERFARLRRVPRALRYREVRPLRHPRTLPITTVRVEVNDRLFRRPHARRGVARPQRARASRRCRRAPRPQAATAGARGARRRRGLAPMHGAVVEIATAGQTSPRRRRSSPSSRR